MLKEIERIRGVAILAVVIIHMTAQATITYPAGSRGFLFYNIVNSLVQFAVPLFLFISAVVLSRKLHIEKNSPIAFYLKRVPAVLIPYLIWSMGYSLLRAWQNSQLSFYQWLKRWPWELWTGTSYYHLYYFLIILQLYLLLPILVSLIRNFQLWKIILAAIIMQLLFYILNKQLIYAHYPYPGNLLGSYLPIVLIGCWLGLNYERVKPLAMQYRHLASIFFLFCAVLFTGINILTRSGDFHNLTLYYVCYHLFTLAAAWRIWLWSMGSTPCGNAALSLGVNSFAVYLIHPFLLSVWQYIWQKDRLISFGFTLVLGFIFVLAGSYAFALVVKRWALIRKILIGR